MLWRGTGMPEQASPATEATDTPMMVARLTPDARLGNTLVGRNSLATTQVMAARVYRIEVADGVAVVPPLLIEDGAGRTATRPARTEDLVVRRLGRCDDRRLVPSRHEGLTSGSG